MVRGQYARRQRRRRGGAGLPARKPACHADSRTETFVALRTEIANWRWAGVPFYMRTGKRLAGARRADRRQLPARRRTRSSTRRKAPPNRLVINLQPEDGLELHLLAQARTTADARPARRWRRCSWTWTSTSAFGAERVGAYERLLLDVIAGRLNLFVRSDEQEEAWRWVEPILEPGSTTTAGPRPYAAGTWGPARPARMIARDGYCWTEEQ